MFVYALQYMALFVQCNCDSAVFKSVPSRVPFKTHFLSILVSGSTLSSEKCRKAQSLLFL